jgi:hypothetical protein
MSALRQIVAPRADDGPRETLLVTQIANALALYTRTPPDHDAARRLVAHILKRDDGRATTFDIASLIG